SRRRSPTAAAATPRSSMRSKMSSRRKRTRSPPRAPARAAAISDASATADPGPPRSPYLGRPKGAQVDRGVAWLPTTEEALDRRVDDDPVEVAGREEAVTADGRVLRGDRLERAAAEIAGEDDVDDVLLRERPLGRDR